MEFISQHYDTKIRKINLTRFLLLFQNVPLENPNPEDGYVYYEQLQTSYGTYKIGTDMFTIKSHFFPPFFSLFDIFVKLVGVIQIVFYFLVSNLCCLVIQCIVL